MQQVFFSVGLRRSKMTSEVLQLWLISVVYFERSLSLSRSFILYRRCRTELERRGGSLCITEVGRALGSVRQPPVTGESKAPVFTQADAREKKAAASSCFCPVEIWIPTFQLASHAAVIVSNVDRRNSFTTNMVLIRATATMLKFFIQLDLDVCNYVLGTSFKIGQVDLRNEIKSIHAKTFEDFSGAATRCEEVLEAQTEALYMAQKHAELIEERYRVEVESLREEKDRLQKSKDLDLETQRIRIESLQVEVLELQKNNGELLVQHEADTKAQMEQVQKHETVLSEVQTAHESLKLDFQTLQNKNKSLEKVASEVKDASQVDVTKKELKEKQSELDRVKKLVTSIVEEIHTIQEKAQSKTLSQKSLAGYEDRMRAKEAETLQLRRDYANLKKSSEASSLKHTEQARTHEANLLKARQELSEFKLESETSLKACHEELKARDAELIKLREELSKRKESTFIQPINVPASDKNVRELSKKEESNGPSVKPAKAKASDENVQEVSESKRAPLSTVESQVQSQSAAQNQPEKVVSNSVEPTVKAEPKRFKVPKKQVEQKTCIDDARKTGDMEEEMKALEARRRAIEEARRGGPSTPHPVYPSSTIQKQTPSENPLGSGITPAGFHFEPFQTTKPTVFHFSTGQEQPRTFHFGPFQSA
ncbi:hypothetical protein PROFUN_08924 [Planoprotostelium fungivorum]|uniref:Uncharacterized protein n=1 Tax=Planoprotostelium fungivorum TaxID=1890364 RepID=A0A2P6NIQ1_9EUKA|nr:hypothetical protein PROFUN_08924 [Planoprotostelium fungivorum]